MATSKSRRTELPTGFEVTCVIGRVEFDEVGEHSPTEAAFLLIAQHGADGTYSFPSAEAGTCHVTVETEPMQETAAQEW